MAHYIRKDPARRNEYRSLAAAEEANKIILAARAEADRITQQARADLLTREREYLLARVNQDRLTRRARQRLDTTIRGTKINYQRLAELAAGKP